MRHIGLSISSFYIILSLFAVSPVTSHEADQAGPTTHRQLPAVVTKIQSGVVFLKPQNPSHELRNRVVSMKKAERMGLAAVKVGDEVLLTVDEENLLLDIHSKGMPEAGHRLIVGKLSYADPFWEVIQLSTSEGTQMFAVESEAGSKLGVLKEGARVRAELDEDSVVVDIHPLH